MKKLLTLLTLTATVAFGANYDVRYLQENASGKIVERILTLTPSTFLSVSANGTLQVQSSDAFRASIAAMPLAQRSTFSNANATVPAGAVYFGQTGNMTASRVVTLPAASSVSPGYQLVIADESGTVTNANTLVITRAGSDLINGATTETIGTAFAHRRLISNGVNAWLFDAGVARLGAGNQTFSGSLSLNGNFVAGDAAGDEFSATDDDPQFPNVTASSVSAGGAKTGLNREAGDARYTNVYGLIRPTSGVAIRLNVPQWSTVTAAGGSVGTGPTRAATATSTSNSTAFTWSYTPFNNGSNQLIYPSSVSTGARFLLILGSGSMSSLNGAKFGFGGILNSDTLIPWGTMNVRGACVEWQRDMATGNDRMRIIVENAAGTENVGAWQTVVSQGVVFECFLWVRDGTAQLRVRRWNNGNATSLTWAVNTSLTGAPSDTASFTTPSIWYGAVNHAAAANSVALECYDVTVFQITDDLSGL